MNAHTHTHTQGHKHMGFIRIHILDEKNVVSGARNPGKQKVSLKASQMCNERLPDNGQALK